MNDIASAARLSYFEAERHEHGDYTFDASCAPRPRFCIGLLIEGTAEFTDCTGSGRSFTLKPGELVFVPITTRYISRWYGEPRIKYISLHFVFEPPAIFSRGKGFCLQRLAWDEPEKLLQVFEAILSGYTGSETEQLTALAGFYGFLSELLPRLEVGVERKPDARLGNAIEYIESHYSESITVELLASLCSMSVSRFFPCFRASLGVTPIDYLNHYRINRSISLLMNSDMTIESVSGAVGFESSSYFRRVFKRITGKNPREYRKLSGEF